MNPEFAYLLKVNLAFVLFYAFYRLFFYKDTFFKLRRSILLAFFILALGYPLFNMQEWIKEQEPIIEVVYVYSSILPEVTITAEAASSTSWIQYAKTGLFVIYVLGIALLIGRFLIQLSSILWLAHNSRRGLVHQVPVRVLNNPAGPFSFFGLIFLHPESHSDKETDEILTHEQTHVSQWHSVDVMLSEIVSIVCWYNPFVWFIKREVRHNLEYLADNSVLQSGYDSRSYQYHLLGLAHSHQKESSIYNSFNVLHLKNRILMMNKRRSHGFWRTKYFLFVPLVLLLMLLSNIEALARMTAKLATEVVPVSVLPRTNTPEPFHDNVPVEVYTTHEATTKELMEYAVIPGLTAKPDIPVPTALKPAAKEHVFTIVEKLPEFPGGDKSLLTYLKENMQYPLIAQENGIQGRVVVTYIVNKTGDIRSPEILRGVDPSLDKEAIRLVQSMPRWIPGKQNGEQVNVRFTLPINFVLGDKTDKEKVHNIVSTMPSFPGGDGELLKFLNKNIKYPIEAQELGIQGRVVTSFIIDSEGNISDIQIARGIDPSLDQEAARVIAVLPRWKPGEIDGVPVKMKYTLPIAFRLQ